MPLNMAFYGGTMKLAYTLSVLLSLTLLGATSYAEQQIFSTETITVVDEANQPVSNATILLGYDVNNPFPGNSFVTDAKGVSTVPSDWKAALPLTVQAAGFIATTIPVATPGTMTVQLTKQEGQSEFEVKGDTTDFGRLVSDGKVDFGLVIPAISRQQMLGFDLSMVLSPKTDAISVAGRTLEIPSNVALPKQSENYLFIPVNFDKAAYRVYMRDAGQYDVFALHGQFPLTKVVDDIRAGKSMFDVINHFNFLGGTVQPLDVQGNIVTNLPVNQMTFPEKVNVKAPGFAANQVMISLSAFEQNGRLLPTDLKRLTANQNMNLKATTASPTVLSVLLMNAAATLPSFVTSVFAPMNIVESYLQRNYAQPVAAQDFSQLSFALQDGTGGVAPQFLPLIDKPQVVGQTLKFSLPTLPADLVEAGTYMVYSEIETINVGTIASERRTRLWQIFANSWVPQVELPKLAFANKPDRKYRWEVIFLARPATFVRASDASLLLDLNGVSHVTRNALDL